MNKRKTSVTPGSNWAQLQKTLTSTKNDDKKSKKGKGAASPSAAAGSSKVRSKPDWKGKKSMVSGLGKFMGRSDVNGSSSSTSAPEPIAGPSKVTLSVTAPSKVKEDVVLIEPPPVDTALVHELREMVAGRNVLNEAKRAIAIDCEMVGLGHLGSESALARVSLINYHGSIIYDTFVQPRERVTDWRTWISGVRESDVAGAPGFEEVQKKVAEIVEGRVLVGHAIDNDLKVLLLSHPNPLIRDTQKCKMLREKAKNKHPGLKKLAEMELGIQIQKGSHSSVTDARATMALYRLHKSEWEQQLRHTTEAYRAKVGKSAGGGKRKRDDEDDDDADEDGEGDAEGNEDTPRPKKGKKERQVFPGGGRKGISSGLGVIIRRNGQRIDNGGTGGGGSNVSRRERIASASSAGNWWEEAAG
ncbi:hypothetical protein CI109_106322 [Kwoniella shandongensis]|uniref:RNA exonuclease 4 n=1 Tax=Kwoniella shandongensis TaxID=1734106 RepID=A0AAJ8LS66_9TREE